MIFSDTKAWFPVRVIQALLDKNLINQQLDFLGMLWRARKKKDKNQDFDLNMDFLKNWK